MNDALVMRRFQRFGDLTGDGQDLRQTQADRCPSTVGCSRFGDQVGQRAPLDELHDQGAEAVALFETMDGRDVGVIQRREHLRFAAKTGQRILIVEKGFGQDLHGDVAIEPRVAGAIDLSHPASTAELQDFVRADSGTNVQGHGLTLE